MKGMKCCSDASDAAAAEKRGAVRRRGCWRGRLPDWWVRGGGHEPEEVTMQERRGWRFSVSLILLDKTS